MTLMDLPDTAHSGHYVPNHKGQPVAVSAPPKSQTQPQARQNPNEPTMVLSPSGKSRMLWPLSSVAQDVPALEVEGESKKSRKRAAPDEGTAAGRRRKLPELPQRSSNFRGVTRYHTAQMEVARFAKRVTAAGCVWCALSCIVRR